jgi:arsenate reductase (glutaredoxin)
MIKMYGIKNCDSVKAAQSWLKDNNINFSFYDFKKQAPAVCTLVEWSSKIDINLLLNKRSKTWRELDSALKNDLDHNQIIDLLHVHPTLIKRPVLIKEDLVTVGFNDTQYSTLFSIKE